MYIAGVLYSCGAAVSWALAPIFLKKGFAFMNLKEMSAVRTFGFVGASFMFALLDPQAFILWRFPAPLLSFILLNILTGNILGDVCYFKALDLIGVSKAVAVTCCYPLFVTFISFFLLGEPLTFPLLMGTVVMIAGLVMLKFGGGKEESPRSKRGSRAGFLLALFAALCWASTMVLQRWLMNVHKLPPATVTLWRSFFLFAFCWGFWGWSTRDEPGKRRRLLKAPPLAWGYAFAAGVFGLAAGGYTFAQAVKIIPVSVATPISATSPMIAAAMAVFLFKESMRPVQWAGILCIIAGVVYINA